MGASSLKRPSLVTVDAITRFNDDKTLLYVSPFNNINVNQIKAENH
jgi:hypothetical protein